MSSVVEPSRLTAPALAVPDGPSTLAGWLRRAADIDRAGTGLRFLDRRERETLLSWPDVLDRASRAARCLADAGVQAGDSVAIILPTGPGFADAFFGCQVLGAVPVSLYPPVRLGRLDAYHEQTASLLHAAGASILITEARIARLLGQTLARYRPPLGVVAAPRLLAYDPVEIRDVAADDLAMVQFSSGTTVDPKPVALTHRQVLNQTHALLESIRATGPEDTRAGVSWLPLYHDMGLIGCIFPALVHPGPLTLLPPEAFLARPALWLRALSRYRGTVSPAPNFAYAMCVERIKDEEIEGIDLSSWAMALNGAEPVSAATLRAFADRFAPYGLNPEALTPVYGLSEAALAVTFDAVATPFASTRFSRVALAEGRAVPASGGQEVVSVGTPVAGFEVEVRNGDEVVAAGTVGQVWTRGPSIMQGYLGRDAQPFRDGWLDTGDRGFVHDGKLHLTGRAKDVLILRGKNHAPYEVERAVDVVDGVRTGCSVAVGDVDEDGERLVVFVEVRQARDDLAQACRLAVLAATGLDPALVVLLEPGTLPRTSSGKLRRGEALRQWRTGVLLPPDKVGPGLIAGAFARSALGRLGIKV